MDPDFKLMYMLNILPEGSSVDECNGWTVSMELILLDDGK